MSKFDFYMIDTIKTYSDKLRNSGNDEDINWSLKNVLEELTCAYAVYKSENSCLE
jgi:hypothetical protein